MQIDKNKPHSMKKPTHTQQQQQRHKQVQAIVCDAFDWNEGHYNEYLFKRGKQFLQAKMGRFPEMVDAAVQSFIFWNYWRNCWAFRDECFINTVDLARTKVEWAWKCYEMVHQLDELVQEVVLPDWVMKEILNIKAAKQ